MGFSFRGWRICIWDGVCYFSDWGVSIRDGVLVNGIGCYFTGWCVSIGEGVLVNRIEW